MRSSKVRILAGLSLVLAGGLILSAAPALATGPSLPSAAPDGTVAAPFETLSPGNKLIAEALHRAQKAPGQSGKSAGWSLDRLAAARASGQGWGEIFEKMKTEGAVSARDLGEVMNKYWQPAGAAFRPSHAANLIITDGMNDTTFVTGANPYDPRALRDPVAAVPTPAATPGSDKQPAGAPRPAEQEARK